VERLRVQLDGVAFRVVARGHVTQRIRIAATAHDADLWTAGSRSGGSAEADLPTETHAEIHERAAASGVPRDAQWAIVADRVAVVVTAGRNVVGQRRLH